MAAKFRLYLINTIELTKTRTAVKFIISVSDLI